MNVDIGWRKLALSSESEFVIDLHHRDDDFFYTWSQGTWAVTDVLRLGVVVQRTKTFETALDLQRGPMAELSRGAGWLGFYWFNLDRPDDEVFVFAGGYAF